MGWLEGWTGRTVDGAHVLTDKHSSIHLIVLLDYHVDCGNRRRDLVSEQPWPYTHSERSLLILYMLHAILSYDEIVTGSINKQST